MYTYMYTYIYFSIWRARQLILSKREYMRVYCGCVRIHTYIHTYIGTYMQYLEGQTARITCTEQGHFSSTYIHIHTSNTHTHTHSIWRARQRSTCAEQGHFSSTYIHIHKQQTQTHTVFGEPGSAVHALSKGMPQNYITCIHTHSHILSIWRARQRSTYAEQGHVQSRLTVVEPTQNDGRTVTNVSIPVCKTERR